jgi:hypothetical protein
VLVVLHLYLLMLLRVQTPQVPPPAQSQSSLLGHTQ